MFSITKTDVDLVPANTSVKIRISFEWINDRCYNSRFRYYISGERFSSCCVAHLRALARPSELTCQH